jgi:hypothetical protein
VLDLVLGDRNAREMRDAADGGGVDGHGALPKRTEPSEPIAEQPLRRQPAALLRGFPEASI